MSAQTLSEQIYRIVAHRPGGTTVAELHARLGATVSSKVISASCHTLVRHGYFWLEKRPGPGLSRGVCRYYVTDKVRHPVAPRRPILGAIRDALDTHGAQTLGEVAWRVGASRRAVHDALTRMMKGGEVRRTGTPNAWRYALADDEDEAYTPKPYIHPIRARALGLAA